MPSNDKGDLNAKDTAVLLTEWKQDYLKVVDDVNSAITKLKETKQELDEEKKKYNRSLIAVFKDNPKISIFFLITLLALSALIFAPGPFSFGFGSIKIEKGFNCPSSYQK